MKPELKKAFEEAAEQNYWSDADSLSGPGSNMVQTREIRKAIPALVKQYNVKRMLDAPCGDMFWMKTILPELLSLGVEYHGADIVAAHVDRHKENLKNPNVYFHNIDLTKGQIPKVDLIFTRDCFIHLSYENIYEILCNYKQSGATYLLTNTYTKQWRKNFNVDQFYLWGRMLNLNKYPFYFGEPLVLINEGCTEGDGAFDDKSLGLWKINDLPLTRFKIFITSAHILKKASGFFAPAIQFNSRVINFIKRKLTVKNDK